MIEKNKKCLSDISGHDLLDINIIDLFTPDFKMIWTYFTVQKYNCDWAQSSKT